MTKTQEFAALFISAAIGTTIEITDSMDNPEPDEIVHTFELVYRSTPVGGGFVGQPTFFVVLSDKATGKFFALSDTSIGVGFEDIEKHDTMQSALIEFASWMHHDVVVYYLERYARNAFTLTATSRIVPHPNQAGTHYIELDSRERSEVYTRNVRAYAQYDRGTGGVEYRAITDREWARFITE